MLSDGHQANIVVIKDRLEKRLTLTIGLLLSYALSPLPSNFLLIAYEWTGLPLLSVALRSLSAGSPVLSSVSWAVSRPGDASRSMRWCPALSTRVVYRHSASDRRRAILFHARGLESPV